MHTFFVPLSVSQFTALEQYDGGKISGGSDYQILSWPGNDATNASSFLFLGIIDHSSSEDLQTCNIERFVIVVERIILNFSRKVNKVRNHSTVPGINQAYKILSKSKLLSHVFDFTKIFVILCMKRNHWPRAIRWWIFVKIFCKYGWPEDSNFLELNLQVSPI